MRNSLLTALPSHDQKNVLVIGGGTGLPRVIEGLLSPNLNVVACVTPFDNGGNAGEFRERDGSPSFGDVMRAVVPYSGRTKVTNLFERKLNCFGGSHKLRNAIASNWYHRHGRDFGQTIDHMHRLLRITGGEVIPTSLDPAHLHARLENGEVIEGETKIDVPEHDGMLRIMQIWLQPSVPANPRFIEAIRNADHIVFSSGDLYTSVLAALLPEGIRAAIKASQAKKTLILNMMTKYGETYGYRLDDFVVEFDSFFGCDVLDHVLVNSTIPSTQMQQRYRGKRSQWIWTGEDHIHSSKYQQKIVCRPLLAPGELVRHDSHLIRQAFQGYPWNLDLRPHVTERISMSA